jgi:hypothetical protein
MHVHVPQMGLEEEMIDACMTDEHVAAHMDYLSSYF